MRYFGKPLFSPNRRRAEYAGLILGDQASDIGLLRQGASVITVLFIVYYYQQAMFETTSELSIPDNKSEQINSNQRQINLPIISQKPASRGDTSHKRFSKKEDRLVLPNIRDQDNLEEETAQETKKVRKDKKNSVQHAADGELANKSTFAREVEEKLKLVLGGMQNEGEVEEVQDSFDSDDFDFEAKINANKELIKMHRIKQQNQNVPNQLLAKNPPGQPPKPKKAGKNRNESLYEKRVREYRDQSIENKYLQKRKQTVKEKQSNSPSNQVRESLKEIKSKDYVSSKAKQPSSSKKGQIRALSQKSSKKDLHEINKSVNLFDGIQNYLENPRDPKEMKKDPTPKPLIGLSLLKAKRDIEDKIKAINEKLGILTVETDETDREKEPNKIPQHTVREWRRIEIAEKNINYQESNFDRELERISSLQERNSLSLEKYLEHQKILLELELRRKEMVRQSNTQ